MEMTSEGVQAQGTNTQRNDAWKDRVLIGMLTFGGVLTVGWCGAIMGAAMWLAGRF